MKSNQNTEFFTHENASENKCLPNDGLYVNTKSPICNEDMAIRQCGDGNQLM